MIRTQIQLDEDQYRRLKTLSARSSKSVAELVRRGVDTVLADAEAAGRWAAAWTAVGSAHDLQGRSDVAERHDQYLQQLYDHG